MGFASILPAQVRPGEPVAHVIFTGSPVFNCLISAS